MQIGVSRQSVSKWEAGISQPELSNIQKICDVLEITPNELMGYNIENKEKSNSKLNKYIVVFLVISGLLIYSLITLQNKEQYYGFYVNDFRMEVIEVEETIKTYELSFRIVRFPINEDSYEIIVTNLDRFHFPVEKIKEIYHLRWGIETSFRELKYAVGITSFHARKPDYIKQEIYAKLLLYNYCELITTHVIQQMEKKDKTKQVNFTIAIYICREYLRQKRNLSPPDVIKLIEKHILPVRPGRKDPRKVKPQASVSFLYRIA